MWHNHIGFVCLLVPFLWPRYLKNTLRKCLQIWHKCPLGLKNELIRIWWSKVTGHSRIPNNSYDRYDRILHECAIGLNDEVIAIDIQKVKDPLHCDIMIFSKKKKNLSNSNSNFNTQSYQRNVVGKKYNNCLQNMLKWKYKVAQKHLKMIPKYCTQFTK